MSTLTSETNVCYCGEYGGGVHTKSARCVVARPSKDDLVAWARSRAARREWWINAERWNAFADEIERLNTLVTSLRARLLTAFDSKHSDAVETNNEPCTNPFCMNGQTEVGPCIRCCGTGQQLKASAPPSAHRSDCYEERMKDAMQDSRGSELEFNTPENERVCKCFAVNGTEVSK